MIDFEHGFQSYTFNEPDSLEFWNHFFKSEFQHAFLPLKYDVTDHPKKPFPKLESQRLLDFYLENDELFIHCNKNLLIWIKQFSKKIYSENYYLEKSKDHLDLRFLLLDNFYISKPFFARGSTKREYDKKHKVIEFFENSGTAEGAIGISRQDIQKYLPGLYSFTVFGAEIIEFFSRVKLKDMKIVFPNIEYFESEHYFGFQIDDENQSLETVIQIQKEIAKYLGQEYFFDRDLIGQVDFKPIPTVIERIR